MISKSLKILLFSLGIMGAAVTDASAQDLEVFKQKMSEAANMTKQDMDEALRMYLEIRTEYGGPEVDYSLGRAYQRLNQCTQAKKFYTAVMTYQLDEKHPIFQRAVKAFDEIAMCDTWQKYYLDCEIPEGGHVLMDDERMNACWNRAFYMSPGDHTFKLVDKSGKSVEKKITAKVGGSDQHVKLVFPQEKKVVEKTIEVSHEYVLKDKFAPELYWGLIAGGAVFIAGGGFFLGMANNAYAEEQKYADLYAVTNDESAKDKASDAHSKVKTGNALMGTFVGIGAAAVASGIGLLVWNMLSDKERVEVSGNDVSAFVTPTLDGVSMGVGLTF